jgi:mRNA interferase MazF
VWFPLGGREQTERRPAIVISPLGYNARAGLAIVCPITSQVKGYPLEVPLPAGLPIHGAVLVDHVRSVDWRSRQVERIARAPMPLTAAVVERLGVLLLLN